MSILSNLRKIGFSEKEASLYVAGLEAGPATLQELVEISKLKRATIYDVIENLKKQGLVRTIRRGTRGKRKVYVMEDPEHLFSFIKQKENALQGIYEDLKHLQNTSRKKPEVHIYQGLEGMKEIYKDLLEKSEEHIEMLSSKMPDNRMKQYWEVEHAQNRVKKGLRIKLIAPDLPIYKKMQADDKYSLRETRLIPAHSIPITSEVYAYNNKVAFVTQEGDDSLGLVVKSEDAYKTINAILQYIWNLAQKE